jgi:hypothetical protein
MSSDLLAYVRVALAGLSAVLLAACGGDASPIEDLLGSWIVESPLVNEGCGTVGLVIGENTVRETFGTVTLACHRLEHFVREDSVYRLQLREIDAATPDEVLDAFLGRVPLRQVACDDAAGGPSAGVPSEMVVSVRGDLLSVLSASGRFVAWAGSELPRYPRPECVAPAASAVRAG